MSARNFLLPSVLARGFFPLEVAAREFSLPAVLARFFFLQTIFALGGFLVSLRAGGLAPPGSHLGAKAGVSCASLRSELWCFFVSAFSHSLRVLKCCSTFLFYEAREILVFSHRGLFRDLYGNAVWGASVPLSEGFFGFAFLCSVGVLRLCFFARVTCFLVALCMWLRAAFLCLSTRSATHVRQFLW